MAKNCRPINQWPKNHWITNISVSKDGPVPAKRHWPAARWESWSCPRPVNFVFASLRPPRTCWTFDASDESTDGREGIAGCTSCRPKSSAKNWKFVKKWANPGLFLIYFCLFKLTLQILQQIGMWKNVHPVYRTGIQTHDLWNMSLLP